jgi:hypothetical protein
MKFLLIRCRISRIRYPALQRHANPHSPQRYLQINYPTIIRKHPEWVMQFGHGALIFFVANADDMIFSGMSLYATCAVRAMRLVFRYTSQARKQ